MYSKVITYKLVITRKNYTINNLYDSINDYTENHYHYYESWCYNELNNDHRYYNNEVDNIDSDEITKPLHVPLLKIFIMLASIMILQPHIIF